MRFRILIVTGIVLTAVVSATGLARATTTTGTGRSAKAVEAPQAACAGWCFFCDVLENKYIVTPDDVTPNDEDASTVCGHHTPCAFECRISTNTTVNHILRVVATANDEQLMLLLRQTPGLKVNLSRRALQLDGCQPGSVVMHVPISDPQVALLSTQGAVVAVAQQ